ncbi:hypothetical protein CF328_g9070, partial [Tilletia controversa]
TPAAGGQGQHQTYYDGRPGSSGTNGGAAAYQGYYSQGGQGQQYQAYGGQQQQQHVNPYADAGMAGSHYHQLSVDQPMSAAEEVLRGDSRPEAQNYFQPAAYGQAQNYASDQSASQQQQQQRSTDGPPRLEDPFLNPRNSGAGSISPLGADTILDGEGMPFANRRSSVRRPASGAGQRRSGSGEAVDSASSGGAGGGSGFLALPMGIDGEGSLLAYNKRFSYASGGTGSGSGNGAASSTAHEDSSSGRVPGGSDGRKSVRTSDGALFTIASTGEK